MSKIYLFAPSSAVFQCPLSMADGAARLLELYGSKQELASGSPYSHLISRNPKEMWTSGQWVRKIKKKKEKKRKKQYLLWSSIYFIILLSVLYHYLYYL
jgi:hypothetical protein